MENRLHQIDLLTHSTSMKVVTVKCNISERLADYYSLICLWSDMAILQCVKKLMKEERVKFVGFSLCTMSVKDCGRAKRSYLQANRLCNNVCTYIHLFIFLLLGKKPLLLYLVET